MFMSHECPILTSYWTDVNSLMFEWAWPLHGFSRRDIGHTRELWVQRSSRHMAWLRMVACRFLVCIGEGRGLIHTTPTLPHPPDPVDLCWERVVRPELLSDCTHLPTPQPDNQPGLQNQCHYPPTTGNLEDCRIPQQRTLAAPQNTP